MSPALVRDLMTAAPVSLSPETSVAELLARFDRHDFNAFPVADQAGRLQGVVSKLDVLRLSLERAGSGRPAQVMADEQVSSFMTRDVVTVGPGDTLDVAGQRMVEARLHSLPVTEQVEGAHLLVGMVSRGDLLRSLRFRLADTSRRSP